MRTPKDRTPESLSLDECETLIREAPEKKRVVRRRAAAPAKSKAKQASNG